MTNSTTGGTPPRRDATGAQAPLPLGSMPFTTVTAGSVDGPKLPPCQGDSWRPSAASMLGVAPLAAVAAVTAMSLMGGASATATRHSDAAAAQTCVTALPHGALGQLKLPACLGD
jgi:hypothetical protein